VKNREKISQIKGTLVLSLEKENEKTNNHLHWSMLRPRPHTHDSRRFDRFDEFPSIAGVRKETSNYVNMFTLIVND